MRELVAPAGVALEGATRPTLLPRGRRQGRSRRGPQRRAQQGRAHWRAGCASEAHSHGRRWKGHRCEERRQPQQFLPGQPKWNATRLLQQMRGHSQRVMAQEEPREGEPSAADLRTAAVAEAIPAPKGKVTWAAEAGGRRRARPAPSRGSRPAEGCSRPRRRTWVTRAAPGGPRRAPRRKGGRGTRFRRLGRASSPPRKWGEGTAPTFAT